jgi:hypothetical protein
MHLFTRRRGLGKAARYGCVLVMFERECLRKSSRRLRDGEQISTAMRDEFPYDAEDAVGGSGYLASHREIRVLFVSGEDLDRLVTEVRALLSAVPAGRWTEDGPAVTDQF